MRGAHEPPARRRGHGPRMRNKALLISEEITMRILAMIGVLLIVFGVIALGFQSITYFTTERAVDIGPLQIDVQRPHTIVFHPVAGAAAVLAGLVRVMVGVKRRTAG